MISRRKLAVSVVERILSGADSALVIKQLAAYIIENNLESEVDRLLADINQRLAEVGKVTAKVTTARPLDETTKTQIVNYIRQAVDEKSEVSLDETIDPAIVGGVIIETPGKRLDMSVATQLKQLRNA